MQEDGKVLADRAEPERDEIVGRRSDDDVIVFDHRAAEQSVPDCAADEVDFHAGILAEWYRCRRAAASGTRGIVRLLAACGLAVPLSGCYLMQAAPGQLT